MRTAEEVISELNTEFLEADLRGSRPALLELELDDWTVLYAESVRRFSLREPPVFPPPDPKTERLAFRGVPVTVRGMKESEEPWRMGGYTVESPA